MDLQNFFWTITRLSFLHVDVPIQINVGPIKSRPGYSNLFASANSPGGGAIEAVTKFKIKVAEANAKRNPDLVETSGMHSLLYFAYTCISGPIYWEGGLFTLQKGL